MSDTNSPPPVIFNAAPRRVTVVSVGFFIVLALWLATRIYIYSVYQTPNNPSLHPLYPVFNDMAVSLDEGRPYGDLNVSRLLRNSQNPPQGVYNPMRLPDDKTCTYLPVDPGYAVVVWASRHLVYFIPNTIFRDLTVQFFVDLVVLILLFATFLSWGIIPAVGAGALYALNVAFAFLGVTPFYTFWDGIVGTLVLLMSLWAWRLIIARRHIMWPLFLMLCIGLVMGVGVWLRASWLFYGIFILGLFLCFKPLRRVSIIAMIAFAVLAGASVYRSSSLRGHLALSTRMTWHTAFQALGRYPNKYGLEDDDLYLFERAYHRHGVAYNLCDFSAQDNAMHADYQEIFNKDPGYVLQSISSRLFTNIFFNFDENWRPFWNLAVLAMAWAGALWGIIRGGEYRFMGIVAATLYIFICAITAPVFYIRVNYAFLTQMTLVMLAGLFFDMLATGLYAGIKGDWRLAPRLKALRDVRGNKFTVNRFTVVNLLVILTLLFIIGILTPPVQRYLAIPHAHDRNWVSPSSIINNDIEQLLSEFKALTPAEQTRFLAYIHKSVPATAKPATDIANFAVANLRLLAFTAGDPNTQVAFFAHKTHAKDLFEVLARSSGHVSGWRLTDIIAFDMKDPASWDGSRVKFALAPHDELSPQEFKRLLDEKFAIWGWTVMETAPLHYTAVHNLSSCDDVRRAVGAYFNRKCD